MCSNGVFSRKRLALCLGIPTVTVGLVVFVGYMVGKSTFIDSAMSNVLFQNKCIEDLGCFYNGPPFFHPINRPISFSPADDLNTKFVLFTPSNSEDEEQINATEASIRVSSFDPQLAIKVLIHGFRSDLDVDDVRFQMKDELLKEDDYNIIIVDWTEYNGPPYARAISNARVVGAQLARLLKLIMKIADVKAQDIHIIGHSLGSHIAGWTGERMDNLGRITALDPAGPYFQDAEKSVSLDTTDALFVDVIHTNGYESFVDGLGIGKPIGHMDFYPNGGRSQPGCAYASGSTPTFSSKSTIVSNITAKWLSFGCSHNRANDYFLESIDNTNCRFQAVRCTWFKDFEKGDCPPENSTLSEMGLHAKKIEGLPIKSKFYLRTNGSSPFCIEDSIYV